MNHKVYSIIVGGGTGFISNSLENGGASQWFLGAEVPYSQKAFDKIGE